MSAASGTLDDGISRKFLMEEFEKMGIDPEKDEDEYRRFQTSMFSWADFSEYWLRDPMDDRKPLRLEKAQRSAVNAIQFGYDIDAYPWIIPAHRRPKEIIMIWPRQFGKTTAVAIAAACAFIFMQKRYNIGTFSLNLEGAQELMERIKQLIEFSPFNYMIESSNLTQLKKVGGKVKCTSYPAGESARGRSLSLALVDEAAKIPDEILGGVILWTLRRVGERWILLSTPRGYKGDFVHHFQTGMKTRPIVCVKCQSEYLQESEVMRPFITQFMNYNLPNGLPSCPKCGANNWTYGVGEYTIVPVDPWNCSWKTADEIRHELDLAGWTPLARQEILGEIIFEGSNVFNRTMLESCVNADLENVPHPNSKIRNYVMGIDFGKSHDASVATIGHFDWQKKKFIWDYMKTIGGEYDDKNYITIRKDFLGLAMLYNPAWIVPDSTGVGDAIVEDMNEDLKQMRRENEWLRAKIYNNKAPTPQTSMKVAKTKGIHLGFVFDMNTKRDIIENMVEGFTTRKDIEIPPYHVPVARDFWDECLGFAYEITEFGNVRYGTQKTHDDKVISYGLAYYVARQKPFVSCDSALG